MVPNWFLALGLVISGCGAAQPRTAEYEQLRPLVGHWKCPVGEGKSIDLAYRHVSSGSAIVETFTTPSGKETLTIFHLDGPRLLATHYCAQGNQPRLRLERASQGTFDFRFHDATNLANADASHLSKLELKFAGDDHYERTETYVEAGKEETTRYVCERSRP